MKKCSDCKAARPLERFSPNKTRKDGLANICKDCTNARGRAAYRKDKSKTRDRYKRFLAANPGKTAEYSRKHYAKNREKRIAAVQQYRRENLDEVRAYWKRYYEAHRDIYLAHNKRLRETRWDLYKVAHKACLLKRKARKSAATIHKFTGAQLRDRIAAQGGRCVYCHGHADTVDHLKPLARGGLHCLANLRPACSTCNSKKRAKNAMAWLASLTRTVEAIPLP